MSLRLRCRSCQAAFVTSKDQVGQSVDCPKCGAPQVVPRPKPAAESAESSEPVEPMLKRIKAPEPAAAPVGKSVFIKKDKKDKGESGASNKGLWATVILVPLLAVGAIIAWPMIRDWLDPRPKTVVEAAAYDYLMALKEGDEAAIQRLGVVQDPPAIRSFRDLKRDKPRDERIKGVFKPIARLHRAIEKKFDYDATSGRFIPKNQLGIAAEMLDKVHEAKEKLEKDKTYDKMASGDPEEAMQAAIDFGAVFAKISEGLTSKKLIPSYRMLVEGANPPLPEPERSLALDYARHRESWDGLLKRPFPTIKVDGPFAFEKAEVTAEVKDKLASSGDPPTMLRLKLVQFETDAIDTKWKVVSARRITPGVPDEPMDEEGPEPEIPSEPAKPSPGDMPTLPNLNLDGLPADTPK